MAYLSSLPLFLCKHPSHQILHSAPSLVTAIQNIYLGNILLVILLPQQKKKCSQTCCCHCPFYNQSHQLTLDKIGGSYKYWKQNLYIHMGQLL